MKKLFLILMVICNYNWLSGQDNQLDSTTLKAFEEEAKYKYTLFFESVLSIIDDRLPIEDRYRSRSILIDLCENSNTIIFDIIDTKYPQAYKPSSYGFKLIEAGQKIPLYYKKYKYSEDFKLDSEPFKGTYDNENYFAIYKGNLFVLENLINSSFIPASVVNSPSFNAYENGLLKNVEFYLKHNKDGVYDLRIKQIGIHKENQRDYKDLKSSIKKNAFEWSDQSEEDYVEKIKEEARDKGIELIPTIKSFNEIVVDTNIINQLVFIDSTKYQAATLRDYIIPGLGHMKYGRTKTSRVIKLVTYAGLFFGSTGYAVYNKIQADKYYNLHLDAETFRTSQSNLDVAKNYNNKFLISSGVALLTWVSNAVHLKLSDSKQKKLIINSKNQGKMELGYDFNYLDHLGPQISLNLRF